MAYEKDVVSLLNFLGVEQRNNAYYEMADEVEDVYAKAKMYDEHTCGEPTDININITLTKKSIEDLEHKDFKRTVKAKLNNKGGLL